jgi:hypothetical protein
MKTRITLLIGAVALITLSFTFANVDTSKEYQVNESANLELTAPVGGIIADEVIR